MNNLSGKTIGQYEIVDVIGKGGMATVYRARQRSMSRAVAIKVIVSQYADSPEFVTRFEREAELIARLQHPHILPVYDSGRDEGLVYIAMRLVDGGSLDQRLDGGALPTDQAVRMFSQIASALTFAHRAGVIHRDIKPNNILLDDEDNTYLTDFGIAKIVASDTRLTGTNQMVGTPAYMAPEQWRSQPVDARTDIYALGIMLYEMLTGKLPFSADTPFGYMYAHFDQMPAPPNTLNAALPDAVGAVINKAIAKSPADRYTTADALARDLEAAVSGRETTATFDPASGATAIINLEGGKGQTPTTPLSSTGVAPFPRRKKTMRLSMFAVVAAIIITGGLLLTYALMISREQVSYFRTAESRTGTAFYIAAHATTASTTTATITVQPTLTALTLARTLTPTLTSKPATAVPTTALPIVVPPTASAAATLTATVTATLAATNTALPTTVTFKTFRSRPANVRFNYPADWEVDNSKFGANIFFITEHIADLTFAKDGTVSGPPYIQMIIGDAAELGILDMATARDPAQAMAIFMGDRARQIDPVLGAKYPTVVMSRPNADLGVIKTTYLSMLGPDHWAVMLMQTPPDLSDDLNSAIALPLVRSLDFLTTPTEPAPATPTETPQANATFSTPAAFKPFTLRSLGFGVQIPSTGWNVSIRPGYALIQPADSETVIKAVDNFSSPSNTLGDGPFVVIQKLTSDTLRGFGANSTLKDLYRDSLGEASVNPTEYFDGPFPTVYGRASGQSQFTPINGWLALVRLDDDTFLQITAQAPYGHEDEFLQSVLLPIVQSIKYPLPTPTPSATP